MPVISLSCSQCLSLIPSCFSRATICVSWLQVYLVLVFKNQILYFEGSLFDPRELETHLVAEVVHLLAPGNDELNEGFSVKVIPRTVEPVWQFGEIDVGCFPQVLKRKILWKQFANVGVVCNWLICEFFAIIKKICIFLHFFWLNYKYQCLSQLP